MGVINSRWKGIVVAVARNPFAVYFGENLRACRRRAGISQEKLGQNASLHRTEVGLLERGARVPRIDTLIKLASALSISPVELLAAIDWKKPSTQRAGSSSNSPGEIAKHEH
jgi:transcriptional regulator with XRE-family HTH domain